jgi:hypothetical protein
MAGFGAMILLGLSAWVLMTDSPTPPGTHSRLAPTVAFNPTALLRADTNTAVRPFQKKRRDAMLLAQLGKQHFYQQSKSAQSKQLEDRVEVTPAVNSIKEMPFSRWSFVPEAEAAVRAFQKKRGDAMLLAQLGKQHFYQQSESAQSKQLEDRVEVTPAANSIKEMLEEEKVVAAAAAKAEQDKVTAVAFNPTALLRPDTTLHSRRSSVPEANAAVSAFQKKRRDAMLLAQLGKQHVYQQSKSAQSKQLEDRVDVTPAANSIKEMLVEEKVAAAAAAKAEQDKVKAEAAAELEANIMEEAAEEYEAAESAELLGKGVEVVWEMKDKAKGVVEVIPTGSFKKNPAQSNIKASSGKPSFLSLKLTKTIVVWLAATSMGIFALLKTTACFDAMMAGVTGVGAVAGQTAVTAAGTGVLAGSLHTLAGPDHFAGVMPLVIGQRRSTACAFGTGALWGSGHAFGQLLLGLACLAVQMGLLRFAWTSSFAGMFGDINDLLIGLALMSIGWLGFKEAHQFDQETEVSVTSTQRYGFTTFGAGILHGLAPDSLVFLAPALALPKVAAVGYLGGIAVGTLLAMGGFTATLKIIAARRSVKLKLFSQVASGTAVFFGTSFLIAAVTSYTGWSFAWPLTWGKALA